METVADGLIDLGPIEAIKYAKVFFEYANEVWFVYADRSVIRVSAIRNWVKQAELDEGHRQDGLTTDEREELSRLQRENRQLKMERVILKKAAAWFAKEATPDPSTNS